MLDLTEIEKCATYTRDGDRCVIKCKLGLWSVEGPFGIKLMSEADHYFQQYKSDGEYHEIIGGESPSKILKARLTVQKEMQR